MDVAQGNWSVVALDHQRILRGFGDLQMRPCWSGDVHVLVDQLAVEEHALEARRFDLPGSVESRCAKPGLIRLPFAGTARRIDERRRTADTLFVDPLVIDRAA